VISYVTDGAPSVTCPDLRSVTLVCRLKGKRSRLELGREKRGNQKPRKSGWNRERAAGRRLLKVSWIFAKILERKSFKRYHLKKAVRKKGKEDWE